MRRFATILGLALVAVGYTLADVKATVQDENTVCSLVPLCSTVGKNGASCNADSTKWTDIMHTSIATSNSVSLTSVVSLVTGIMTDVTGLTNVSCTGSICPANGINPVTGAACTPGTVINATCQLNPSGGTATGEVQVLLVMDGHCSGATCADGGVWDGDGTPAVPNSGGAGKATHGITFQENVEKLSVTLGQIFQACGTVNGIAVCTPCGTTGTCNQSVELALTNVEAHAFGFILPNVGVAPNSAPHTLDVFMQNTQANFAAIGNGTGQVAVCGGQGSIITDVARLGHGFNCTSSGCSSQ